LIAYNIGVGYLVFVCLIIWCVLFFILFVDSLVLVLVWL